MDRVEAAWRWRIRATRSARRQATDRVVSNASTPAGGSAPIATGAQIPALLPLAEATVATLEAMGYRRAILPRSTYHKLPQDVLSLDFSGWTVFVHAEADDDLVTQICTGLLARKARIPWEEPGELPVERMAREAPDTPQTVPLHPAAERFWRGRGYL